MNMRISDIKLVNFDKYLKDDAPNVDNRNDYILNTKINMVLNHIAVCCSISGLTLLEFVFLKEMATSAVVDLIELGRVSTENTEFVNCTRNLVDLTSEISADTDSINTNFGILPLFMIECNGYFRFSGSSLISMTGGRIMKYLRMYSGDTDKMIEVLKNDLLQSFSDMIRSYHNNVDPYSEAVAHYKFYSTSSDVTLLDLKTSNGILNFLNASESDKVLGLESIKNLNESMAPRKAIIDDAKMSFVIQGPISSFGLFSIYTNAVSLNDVDSFRLIMNGRDLLYPASLLYKYTHRIENAITKYLNARDECLKNNQFTIEDIYATIPSNTLCRYIVNMSIKDAINILEDLADYSLDENTREMAYIQFYEICKKIQKKAELVVNSLYKD